MGLYEDIAEFRKMISRIAEDLEEIDADAARIPDTDVDSLGRKFTVLDENLEETAQNLRKAIESLDDIHSKWGRG